MATPFDVGSITVGGGRTAILAEAGVNHLKRLDLAERLIKEAAESGADVIKFQTYSADGLVVQTAPRFWDWKGEAKKGGSQHDSYDRLATPEYGFTSDLRDMCIHYNVEFMSTPFDRDAVEVLEKLDVSAYKIASGDITNFILLDDVASTGKPIFLSTGGSTAAEIERAVDRLEIGGARNICIMHCSLCYPTRMHDANLLAIVALAEHFPKYPIGLSDHTIGPFIPSLSIPLGCAAIEKHYTVDKTLPDSADHWLSIDSEELKQMVENCRIAEACLGHKSKSLSTAEESARANARRSLVLNRDVAAGTRITKEMLTAKRPATGISPIFLDHVIGQKTSVDKKNGEIIFPNDIEGDQRFKMIYPSSIEAGPV